MWGLFIAKRFRQKLKLNRRGKRKRKDFLVIMFRDYIKTKILGSAECIKGKLSNLHEVMEGIKLIVININFFLKKMISNDFFKVRIDLFAASPNPS